MNDTLNDDLLALGAIDPAGPPDPQAHHSEQARTLLDSITSPATDELAERRRRRRWPILVGAAAAVAAVLALTPNLLGGNAYASWTDVPAAASAADARAAEDECREFWVDFAETPGEGVPAPQVIEQADRVIAEQRGRFTYTVLSDGTWAMDCLVQTQDRQFWEGSGVMTSFAGSLQPLGDSGPLAAAGIADLALAGMGGDDIDGIVLMVYARVGADVSAAVVHTPGVGDVAATITNGYLAAWAPGVPEDALDESAIGLTLHLSDGSHVELTPADVEALVVLNRGDGL